MKQPIDTAACPHCGAPMKMASRIGPAREIRDEFQRYDIEALATQAADERAFDETTRIRVTQQDIRKLLNKRMKAAK
jgi:hypothetical protein